MFNSRKLKANSHRSVIWSGLSAVILFLVTSCGGDGGGSSKPKAFNFSEANAVSAAALMASDQDIIAPFSQIILGVLQFLGQASQPSQTIQPQMVIPVGDIGACAIGSFTLDWDDADGNLALSAGDKAMLTLTACDFEGDTQHPTSITGEIDISFSEITLTGMTADVSVDLLIDENDNGELLRDSLETRVSMTFNSTDGVNYHFTYGWQDSDHILVSRHGTQNMMKKDLPLWYKHGCATIDLDLSLANPAVYQMDFSGVVNDNELGVMSFDTTTALTMIEGSEGAYADAGVVEFTSDGTCAAINAGKGASGSDGSTLILTATGGGDVTLDGIDGNGQTFQLMTTWGQLY